MIILVLKKYFCLVNHNLKALNSDLINQIEVMNELKMYWADSNIHDINEFNLINLEIR